MPTLYINDYLTRSPIIKKKKEILYKKKKKTEPIFHQTISLDSTKINNYCL